MTTTTNYYYRHAHNGIAEMIIASCATGSSICTRKNNTIMEAMTDAPISQTDINGAIPITRTEYVKRYWEMKSKYLPFIHHMNDMVQKETVKIAMTKSK